MHSFGCKSALTAVTWFISTSVLMCMWVDERVCLHVYFSYTAAFKKLLNITKYLHYIIL